MRPIQGVATRLRRLVGSAKARPIPDRLARFDSPEFLAKTESLADPWLREHALNVLKDGYTVIEYAVPE